MDGFRPVVEESILREGQSVRVEDALADESTLFISHAVWGFVRGVVRVQDRLAVTCTRATHGLLLVTRVGIEGLLADAPARPGTPLGDPGMRILPRQPHQRILSAFARGVLNVTAD